MQIGLDSHKRVWHSVFSSRSLEDGGLYFVLKDLMRDSSPQNLQYFLSIYFFAISSITSKQCSGVDIVVVAAASRFEANFFTDFQVSLFLLYLSITLNSV